MFYVVSSDDYAYLDKHFPCTGVNSLRTICERAKLRSSPLIPVRQNRRIYCKTSKHEMLPSAGQRLQYPRLRCCMFDVGVTAKYGHG